MFERPVNVRMYPAVRVNEWQAYVEVLFTGREEA